jgi:hypothetical protein
VAKSETAKLSDALSPSPMNSTVELEMLVNVPPYELVLVVVLVRMVP